MQNNADLENADLAENKDLPSGFHIKYWVYAQDFIDEDNKFVRGDGTYKFPNGLKKIDKQDLHDLRFYIPPGMISTRFQISVVMTLPMENIRHEFGEIKKASLATNSNHITGEYYIDGEVYDAGRAECENEQEAAAYLRSNPNKTPDLSHVVVIKTVAGKTIVRDFNEEDMVITRARHGHNGHWKLVQRHPSRVDSNRLEV